MSFSPFLKFSKTLNMTIKFTFKNCLLNICYPCYHKISRAMYSLGDNKIIKQISCQTCVPNWIRVRYTTANSVNLKYFFSVQILFRTKAVAQIKN